MTEYQFLRVNHFVILSLPKIPHLRRTPARSLQTVCSSLTPACLSSHLLARSPSSSPPPPASTCVEFTVHEIKMGFRKAPHLQQRVELGEPWVGLVERIITGEGGRQVFLASLELPGLHVPSVSGEWPSAAQVARF